MSPSNVGSCPAPTEKIWHCEQVWQKAAESIQLPGDEHITGANKFKCAGQARAIILGTGSAIFIQVPGIDACSQQRVALLLMSSGDLSENTCFTTECWCRSRLGARRVTGDDRSRSMTHFLNGRMAERRTALRGSG